MKNIETIINELVENGTIKDKNGAKVILEIIKEEKAITRYSVIEDAINVVYDCTYHCYGGEVLCKKYDCTECREFRLKLLKEE